MKGSDRRLVLWFRWPYAAVAGLIACATPLPPAPAAADPCEGACARRASLGCLDFPDVCVDVCHRAERAGLYSPACVVAAETREALEACRVRCAP